MFEEILIFCGIMVGIIVGFVLLASIIIMPFCYMSECSNIEAFNSVKQSVAVARDNHTVSSKMERITLQNKIIDWNAWLARAQYWNSIFPFSLYYPERIKNLEPIG